MAGDDDNVIAMRRTSKLPGADAAFLSGFAGDSTATDDECGGRDDDKPAVRPLGLDVRAVLAAWRSEGALVHEPTGIETLDRITRGGLVYGTTTYLQGAPNACKTVFSIHLAHEYAKRGIAVGFLASDESASDLVTRLAQRIGFERDDVEKREHGAIDVIERHVGALPIRFYDDAVSIEEAAEDLVRFAAGRRALLVVDSLQVVKCLAEMHAEREFSEQRQISARTIALRRTAERLRLLVLVTSETSRASYRARTEEDRIEDIAAGKGSGSIEFKSKVLLTMRKMKRAPGVYSVSPTKNKLQRDDSDDPFFLKLDRDRQTLEECEKPSAPEDAEQAEARAQREARDEARDAKIAELAEQILAALVQANVKGARIMSRGDLLGLPVKGDSNLKGKAITALIGEGKIKGGRGKPFAPRYADEPEPEEPKPDPKAKDAERSAAAIQRVLEDALVVATVLAAQPGLGTRDLRAACRARSGVMSSPRCDAGLARLEAAVVRVRAAKGPGVFHHLDGSRVPADVLAALPADELAAVVAARPPTPPEGS